MHSPKIEVYEDPKDTAMRAVIQFGPPEQTGIAVEEMGELIVALSHYKRKRVSSREVIEEIADVWLALESLKHIFGYDKVEAILLEKTKRLSRRVEEAKSAPL